MNDGRIAPGVAVPVDPDGDAPGRDIDEIRHAVAIHIADEEALGIKADPGEEDCVLEARAVAHGDASAPATVASIGPVLDMPILDQEDVLKAVAGHIPELYAWVFKRDVREIVVVGPLAHIEVRPALLGIVVLQLELQPGSQRVRHPVAVEVQEAHVGRAEIDCRRAAVGHESPFVPLAIEGQREIAGARPVDHRQVRPSVAVRVEQLHARFTQFSPVTAPARAASSKQIDVQLSAEKRIPIMKTRPWPLTVAAAIAAIALLATPAEAGGKKKHRHHDWNDGGYTYYHRGWNDGHGYYRPYYRRGYYYPPPYYGPAYYDRGPVVVFRFGFP